ncbi:Maltose/maltodextrin import ATP-binding protein MalK [Methylibium sp. T29-B]|nr:Maltose/maltodextrin import ATP-binding protein MalK [Methylibium sp. T29-B]
MLLRLADVSIRYPVAHPGGGERPAVDGVSFGLAEGEIGVLIGPSGCGKTSLLRAVAGLEPLAGGSISLGDERLGDAATGRHLSPEQRRIGMVFQDYALFPHLSVAQNVAFGLHDLPRAQREQRVAELLDLVAWAVPRSARRTSCRAGSSSASPWPGPWRRRRGCCCWTNPSPASTSICANAWRRSCARFSSGPARRRSSSPTISSRPSRWVT